MKKLFTKLFCKLIRIYQICISSWTPACCRFYPTCSNYAIEALKRHGPAKGLWLTSKRILRCNPYFKGGYDPVPEEKKINGKKH